MKKILLLIIILLSFENFVFAQDNKSLVDNLFHIDQMNSHNKNFALYFKTRDKYLLSGIIFIIATLIPILPSGSFFTTYTATIFQMHR